MWLIFNLTRSSGKNSRSLLSSSYVSPDVCGKASKKEDEIDGHAARMRETRKAYEILVRKSGRRRPLGRPGRRWKDHIKRFPAEAGNYSPHHSVQNGSGAHPASYPMGTRGSFPGGKAAGAWSWPLTSIYCRGQECVELYLHSPISLHGVVLS
jgi:hypothetical protein